MNNKTNRANLNYKTEAHFIRAFVNHYSFVTGLAATLAGKQGTLQDSGIGVNTIFHIDIYEGFKVVNPLMFSPLEEAPYHNVLQGHLFQCCDLLSWIAGTYDAKQLKEHNYKNSPTEFVVETWVAKEDNLNEWQMKSRTLWEGVKWLDAAHTGDGGDRACAGIATFVCDKKTVEEVVDGEIAIIEKRTKCPYLYLRDVLKQKLAEPKHLAGYMG
jgi:hypothetical protein